MIKPLDPTVCLWSFIKLTANGYVKFFLTFTMKPLTLELWVERLILGLSNSSPKRVISPLFKTGDP
jgi:hypothetical protein